MAGELDSLFGWIEKKRRTGQRLALATVVRTWSSAPRTVGSHLAIAEDGAFWGSVSGGCVEGAVIEEALAIIAGEPARVLEFDIADPHALDVGLSCGGRIQIRVEALDERRAALFDRIAAAHRDKRAAALIIRSEDGAWALLDDSAIETDEEALFDSSLVRAAASLALQSGRSESIESDRDYFIRAYPCPARLYLIGAVHIAQVLAPMAIQAGFETCVIDPRSAFATRERFEPVVVCTDWPDDALRNAGITHSDAIVTLTHDPKLDDPALACALESPAFYIGALGSRRTHAQRLERLAALGFADAVRRIHGPVGLPIGGRSPAEIAVSILAHVIAEKYAA
jgi:xanthine dehydrogenase accessory factor